MPKSFDISFDQHGNVVINNIKGVEGSACLDLTRPYVNELEDKANPAETIMDDSAKVYSKDELIDEGI